MIVKDEAALLKGCLEDLAGHVDELIVVDNGSTDDSPEVARSLGARVLRVVDLHHDLARNAYLDAASCDWILVLDADERMTPEGGARLREVTAAAASDTFGIGLPRFDYYGHGRWAQTRLLRLYRRHPRIRYQPVGIHSSVVPSLRAAGGRIQMEATPIHHLDALLKRRDPSKRERYLRLLLAEADKDPRLRCYLGLEYVALGRHREALEQYERAIQVGDPEGSAIAHLFRGGLLLLEGEQTSAPSRHGWRPSSPRGARLLLLKLEKMRREAGTGTARGRAPRGARTRYP